MIYNSMKENVEALVDWNSSSIALRPIDRKCVCKCSANAVEKVKQNINNNNNDILINHKTRSAN